MYQNEVDMSLEEAKPVKAAIHQRRLAKHPSFSKDDAFDKLSKEQQTLILRLRTGHNRLNKYMYTKFRSSTSPNCSCGNIAQTTEHILQECPTHSELKQQTRPQPRILHEKLHSTVQNLTLDFVRATGL
ncbi:hypothetical protein RRG08_008757 [Elysia crispata]|uniref:Reverse transcriptase n=1 Tax=Elysia crispata TaxID=231223 RepID=A0AAE0Z524_9GAST|nr:hypothetical protein RRG08_008757 [Elysia crispata]